MVNSFRSVNSPFVAMLVALAAGVAALRPLGFDKEGWEVVVILALIFGTCICSVWAHELMLIVEEIGRKKAAPIPTLYSVRGQPLAPHQNRVQRGSLSAMPLLPISLGIVLCLALVYAVAVFSF